MQVKVKVKTQFIGKSKCHLHSGVVSGKRKTPLNNVKVFTPVIEEERAPVPFATACYWNQTTY